jgi:predicted dehydrogenase
MNATRWGIIGPGNIAHDFVNDLAFVKTPQVIQAVLGHTEENTCEFAKENNIPQVFTVLDEFIKKAKIDAVYIATPHTLHYEQALACLEERIPVLCEKPMAINVEQTQELIDTAAANNTFLMEGMWIRFLPSICQVIDMIGKGTIGNIISIKASMSYKAPRDPESRYFNPELGGGSLLDLGIYPVFLALQFLGTPHTVKAIGKLSDEEIDEACSVLFHYKNGQYAVLESSLVTQTELVAEITGDRGVIKILSPWNEKPEGIQLDLFEAGKIIYPCKWDGYGFQFEVEEMLDCIENNKIYSDRLSHQFSLSMIKTMDEIRQQIHVKYDMYE